ncbi:YciI family protein [Streptomyces albidoflavus]
MFLLLNTYTVPTGTIDEALPRHRAWVERHFKDGHFIFGGRREPRIGGFVVAASESEAEVRGYLEDEPLFTEGLVTWEIFGLVAQLAGTPELRDQLNSFGSQTSLPSTFDDSPKSGGTEGGNSSVRVRVNGENREVSGSSTVEDLVQDMCETHGFDRTAVSASLDGDVLPPERWSVRPATGADIRIAVLTSGG